MPLPFTSNNQMAAPQQNVVGQPGLLSNPSNMPNDVQGIPLNAPAVGQGQGADIDHIMSVLAKIMSATNLKGVDMIVEQLAMQVQDINIANKLKGLVNAIKYNTEVASRNQELSKNYASPQEIAKELSDELVNYKKMKESTDPNNVKTSQVIKKKKKTRGNPFKVLMGKVGKLLNHGLGKKQIVRELSKEKYWTKEIIEKAVDVVKDYTRKDHVQAVSEMKKIILAEKKEIDTFTKNNESASTAELLLRIEFLKACVDGIDLGYKPENPNKELNVIKKILEERKNSI